LGRRDDSLLVVVLEDRRRGVLGRTVAMPPERYVCSPKEDPAFVRWWADPERPGHFHGDASPYGHAALAWDAARGHYLKADTRENSLATAVLRGDDAELPALVDRLVECGRLPVRATPGGGGRALRYRSALEGCLRACREWSVGLDDIYEFIEARKLLEED
jgi:hypothetical protein